MSIRDEPITHRCATTLWVYFLIHQNQGSLKRSSRKCGAFSCQKDFIRTISPKRKKYSTLISTTMGPVEAELPRKKSITESHGLNKISASTASRSKRSIFWKVRLGENFESTRWD